MIDNPLKGHNIGPSKDFWNVNSYKETKIMNPLAQTIVNAVLSQVSGGGAQQSQMVQSLAKMFLQPGANGASNGLANIVSQFQNSGLDDVMASWIGTGANKSISAEQVQQAMGAEQVAQIAKQVGVSTSEAPNMLAQILPDLINQITPNGKMDDQMIGQILNGLMGGKKAA